MRLLCPALWQPPVCTPLPCPGLQTAGTTLTSNRCPDNKAMLAAAAQSNLPHAWPATGAQAANQLVSGVSCRLLYGVMPPCHNVWL